MARGFPRVCGPQACVPGGADGLCYWGAHPLVQWPLNCTSIPIR